MAVGLPGAAPVGLAGVDGVDPLTGLALGVALATRLSLEGGGEPELGHDTTAALGTDVNEAMIEKPC